MSMSFDKDLNEKQQSMIKELLGDQVVAIDSKTALLENATFNRKQMKEIANKTKQVVTVELNNIGDEKVVKGILYRLTEKGWIRASELLLNNE